MSSPSTWRRDRRAVVVPAVLAITLVLAACSSKSDSSGSGNTGTADLAFFKGKTITYVIPNTPGSAPGLIMTAMKPGLEKALDAKINLVYNSNVATVGENLVAAAKPDGLTIGNMALQVVLNQEFTGKGVPNFALSDISYVGATYAAPSGIFGCKETAFTSYEQLVRQQTPVKIVEITTGSNDELNHLLMAAYPVPHQYLSGYTTADVLVGCQRGDGNFTASSLARALNASGTAVASGLTPLLLSGPVPDGSPNAFLNGTVPTLAEYEKAHPPASALGKQAMDLAISALSSSAPNYTTFGPKGIPPDRLLALTQAFTQVAADPAVTKASLQAAIPPGFVASAAVQSFITTQLQAKALVQQVQAS